MYIKVVGKKQSQDRCVAPAPTCLAAALRACRYTVTGTLHWLLRIKLLLFRFADSTIYAMYTKVVGKKQSEVKRSGVVK